MTDHIPSQPTEPRHTVLLVDDQAVVGEMVRRILRAAGESGFHFCSSAESALDMVRQFRPTVILQDLSMPDVDGLELLDRYQKDVALKDIPVIVLSGKEDPQVKAVAFARGASDYIVKLPDPAELVARVRRHSLGYIHLLQRRRGEQALRDAERTARQAAEEASRANRAKSVFLANMGHELRTPLNSIIGYAEVLKALPELSTEATRAVEQIAMAGADLTQLIERILHVSQIDGEPDQVEPADFDLSRLLDEVSVAFQARCAHKGLEWSLDTAKNVGTVRGDPAMLRQVLVQLLDNAVKFTPSGHVRLTVAVVGEGESHRFDVDDSGPGISPEQRHGLLEALQQGDEAKAEVVTKGGLGSGLSLGRNLVVAMGGRLEIDGAPGGGTRVTFHLPLASGPSGTPQEGTVGDRSETEEPLPHVGLPEDLAAALEQALATRSMTDLKKCITRVGRLGPAGHQLAVRLRELAAQFDLDAIASLLRETST